jgi:hypothetical protein
LLVIPVKESLIYVRPLYLRSKDGRIPELKRVIVAYQNRIVMSETLTQALAEIFGRGVATALAPDRMASTATSVIRTVGDVETPALGESASPVAGSALTTLAAEANAHFRNAQTAQRAGDWATYGEEIKKLEAVLQKMQNAR